MLFALQGGLRSGEIWVEGSRRYANPASYLIASETWPHQRGEVLELTGMPATFAERLAAIDGEISGYLDDLETLLADPNSPVRVDEHGELHLRPLDAETAGPVVVAERDAVVARLPVLPLTELLIEVDAGTSFTAQLTHAGGATPRLPALEHRRNSTLPCSPRRATTALPAWPSSPASRLTPWTGPPSGICGKTRCGRPAP